MTNEGTLVERISRVNNSFQRAKTYGAGMVLGIGDDAAILRQGPNTDWVVTTDASMDGVHFLEKVHPPDSIGYKALARATSDLAAMGAVPRFFFLTLALPANRTGGWLDRMLAGMGRAAREYGLTLAGGDTTRTPSVAMSITVIGEARRGCAVTRAGAKPGDAIYVTGRLGRARLGLDLVRRGAISDRRFQELLASHLYPQIQLKLGHWLATNRVASAMMDVSDGLSSDLGRLCAASRAGAHLQAAAIPRVQISAPASRRLGKTADAMKMALHGGDDYGLLFTVPPRLEKKLAGAPAGSEITRIGEIVRGRRILITMPSGGSRKLAKGGWDPFRS